ncbi:hypothetical protein ABGB07_02245 [Micromonosporaceae bacterium B7E4]
MSEPTKILIFSQEDLPTRTGTPADFLLGVPPVIEFEGEPHHVRSSPYVPAGQMYVIDTAKLDFSPMEWPCNT